MDCPHCHSPRTTPLKRITNLGYAVFCCKDCHRTFNERTNSPFNFLEFPIDMFASLESAQRFCQAYDEVHQFFRPRQRMAEFVSLSDRREHFLQRVDELQEMFDAA